jgi:catecholate siderophore receptor
LSSIRNGRSWRDYGSTALPLNLSSSPFANPITGVGAGGSVFDHIDPELSWRIALIYKPRPNGSIYFDAGNSFNPSAEALSLSLATAPLPPVENNITYEIGTKWEMIDGALSIDGSLFRTKQLNVREPDPTNPLDRLLVLCPRQL